MQFSNTFHEPSHGSSMAVCTNCGKSGHSFRQCLEPVSSYGVLVFRWVGDTSSTWPPYKEFCRDTRSPTGQVGIHAEILMIQRKDSLGFMDIMRGKYKLSDPDYIRKQLHGMTESERNRLLNDDFDKIWQDLWGIDTESSQRYAHDRQMSKSKLIELRTGVDTARGDRYSLADLLRQEPVVYNTPEWGFPKGRRDPYETDIQCAYRELMEETGIYEEDLWKVTNIAPIEENFFGSNDIHYRHIYYLAQYVSQRSVTYDALNPEMAREIGNLAWKNLDDALLLLRPENVEKRGVLLQLATLLRGTVPIYREEVTGENTLREQQGPYVYRSRTQRSGSLLGRTEQTPRRRFFGERQTLRRIPNIRTGQERRDIQIGSGAGAGRPRGRGGFVPGFGRHGIFEQTSEKARVQGNPPGQNHRCDSDEERL